MEKKTANEHVDALTTKLMERIDGFISQGISEPFLIIALYDAITYTLNHRADASHHLNQSRVIDRALQRFSRVGSQDEEFLEMKESCQDLKDSMELRAEDRLA